MANKIQRNDECPCGSGLKYKKCCLDRGTTFNEEFLQEKEVNKTFQYIESHESEHILNTLIGLQLTPENHGKNVRIEELANYLVQNLNNGQQADLQVLKSHLDSEYAYNYMEDLPTNLFCESIVFYGGNYTIFPGIMNNAIETFNTLLSAIFQCESKLPDTFKNHIYQGITLILCLGQHLADKVGIIGNTEGIEDEFRSTFKLKYDSVDFGITQEEILKICEEQNIDSTVIKDFVYFPQNFYDQVENPDLSPLLYYPIIQFNNKYYFLMLSNQANAMNEYILRLSSQYNCNAELVRLYHEKIWSDLVQVCIKMDWSRFNISLPENNISPDNTKEFIFQFDTNRIAYLCFWHNTATQDTLNETFHCDEIVFENLNKRMREVMEYLKSNSQLQDSLFLTLVVYDCIGREQYFMFDKPQEKEYKIALAAFDFVQLASTEKWNKLSLWKFTKSYEKFLQSTMVTPLSDILDMYSLYKAKDESFYLSDEIKPNFLSVEPGDGSRLIKESKLEQNLHGAIAQIDNRLAYIPVIKSADYAPLYKPQYSIGYYALCLETFNFPIWITNKQIENKQMFIQVQNYAEAIGFWLYKLQYNIEEIFNRQISFPLEIELILDNKIFEDVTVQELKNIDAESPYSFSYENHKIEFSIHSSSLPTLSGNNNEGERMMMFMLLNSLNQIEGIDFSDDSIMQAITNAIPLGNAKMILMYDSQNDLQIDNRWLITPLFISESEVNMLLDELPLWVEKEYSIPEKIESPDEKKKFFNLVTKILFEKLAEEIQIFDYKYLLDTLINIHETLVWKREHNKIIIPAQLLCFGDIDRKVEEIQENEENLVKTTLSLRCLVEYLAALPTQGIVKASYDDIDRLLVLMHEIINYGFLSDTVHFKMANPEVGKLKSGRIGISKEFFDDNIKPFAEAYTKENIDKYIQHFDSRFEVSEPLSESESYNVRDENKYIDEAFLKDWGIGYFNIIKFCHLCTYLCIETQSSVITLKEEDFIKSLQTEIPEQEVIAGLNHFSLENRLDYLIAPDGFKNNEVFPWKYNREFSFGRRFIVKYENQDGDILLKWGFRNAIAAQKQLNFLLFEGKLNNGGKEINKLLGTFRKRKGKFYRDEVKDWLKTHSELVVIDYEVEISPDGHLKADRNYGDIDILVYNKNTKTVLSLECKDTNKAKNIHEMKKEMDNYLGREGQTGMIHKHIERHNWLNQHIQDMYTFLNVKKIIRIKSYMLSSEVIPLIYIKSQELPLPIIAYPDLKRKGFKIIES